MGKNMQQKILNRKRIGFVLISVTLIALLVIIITTQIMDNKPIISEISELGLPSSDSLAGGDMSLVINGAGVPLGDSYTTASQYAEEVLNLVNAERAKIGVGPLVGTAELNAAAAIRAAEVGNTFSHYRPDGSLCFGVLNDFGIASSARAENIAGNFRSPEQVVSAWMKSEGHKRNILNPVYNKIGIGVYTDSAGKLSWEQMFTD